ncbi:MAG: hypothetical protein QMD22_07895 [archaeon]|nr:hypothetical protein [archaeon]
MEVSKESNALLENFDESTINYGQLVKERENGRVVGKTMIWHIEVYLMRRGIQGWSKKNSML